MKPIYLEPDEEITSVIDRLSKVSESKIAVVVPKNSTMFQSLVNLKLLARQAKKLGKTVAVISANKVGTRLAKQVGLETYATLGNIASPVAAKEPEVSATVSPDADDTLPDGTPIHRYSPETGGEVASVADDSDVTTEAPEEEPIESEPTQKSESAPPVDPKPEIEEEEPAKIRPAVELSTLPPIISSGGVKSRQEFVFPWRSALVAGGMVLIGLIMTFLFLPKATVTLTFPAVAISDTVSLAAKTTPTEDPNVISGNLLVVEKTLTQDVTATGQKDIGTKATGTLAVKNCEDSSAHVLAAGSKATSGGKSFTTNSAVTVPAGSFSGGGTVCNSSSVSVGVTASEAGDSYNLTGATFTFAGLSSRIAGTGSTSGGVTKQITVLSQTDVDSAYEALKTQLVTDATNELKVKAGQQTILEPSIKQTVVEQKVDKEVGAEADKATASVTLSLTTIAFDQAAVDTAVKDKLSEKLTTDQQLIIPDGSQATPVFKELSDDKTSLSFTVEASGFAAPVIDKKAVAREINNRSVGSAEGFLKDKYQAEEVAIEIVPGWWLKRLPVLSQAISIEYGFNETQPQTRLDEIPRT